MSASGVLEVAAPGNPNKDIEVTQSPDDSISALEFSPATLQQTYLISGGWDNHVRCWEVDQSGRTIPRAIRSMSLPILDVCWSGDGSKVFMASYDNQLKCWDLASNQTMQVAAHEGPVSICNWIEAPFYKCIVTGSWDKTLKFWDLRSSIPMMTVNLSDRVCCSDVVYPIAIFGTASKGINIYNLEGRPSMLMNIESPLQCQHRCIALFKDKVTKSLSGFGLASTGGRAGIFSNVFSQQSAKEYFSFKCHRRYVLGVKTLQYVYAVNDIKFHPIHGTLATVGSDGTYAFWDKETRTRLMISDILDQPITKCCFNSNGQIFAYSTGYDWSKGREYNSKAKKPTIFLRPCFEELKPRVVSTLD